MAGPGGAEGVPDMTVISDIDEYGINQNLQKRYKQNKIYTYTGPILVAVNPYKELPYYGQDSVARYNGAKLGTQEPHVFAIAEAAYCHLKSEGVNQSLVISGESGAGKTETTKFILEYLCCVTANISTWVQQQILEANTILEAFGNAKTIRNDNSSRFGRFMQVCFDQGFKIAGCVIQDYLLEQSRITHQSELERNYHIFYQLTAAAQRDPNLAKQFSVGPPSSYHYLNQSGCTRLDGVDDAAKFDALRLAFEVVQIPQSASDAIFSCLSAILHLGNLKYQQDSNIDSHNDTACLAPGDEEILHTTASLLGIESQELQRVATIRQINISGNVTEIPLKLQEAREHRHAMGKALYSRTFAWLVDHINKCTNPGKDQTTFIGILDIFGFENFACNSFEQLCINYTNEKLHMFFNHYVFKIEQATYAEEEIKFSHITFTDNTRCLELIEKPPRCLLRLLTEQCHMPQGSDKAYLTNLHTEFAQHPDFVKGEDRRRWDKEFGIRHYAGVVLYNVKGFVDKNRDSQQDVFFDILLNSKTTFVQELCEFRDLQSKVAQLGENVKGDNSFSKGTVKRLTNRAKPTVCDAFRLQLAVLVTVLENTNPWYVRCIKPNMEKSSSLFDEKLVLDQLKYLGMLEIIRIKKQGFPVHYIFKEFRQKYTCINIKNRFKIPREDKEAVRYMLKAEGMPTTEWQLGKTKVFLRSVVHEPLEERRRVVLFKSAVAIQKTWRGYKQRRQYLRMWKAAKRIQECFLSWSTRIRFLKSRRAAIVIQAHLRGMFGREVATALREAKRVEEERRRQEKLQEERLAREKERRKELESVEGDAGDDRHQSFVGLPDMNSTDAEEELDKLTKLADRINSQINSSEPPPISNGPQTVDLDQLFNFLSQELPESVAGSSVAGSEAVEQQSAGDKSSILDEIDRQMSDLQTEMDRYSLQDSIQDSSLSGADNEETWTGSGTGTSDSLAEQLATPPPPQEFDSREGSYSPPPLPPPEHQPMMNLQKPSLPEPSGPPPPPPTQNGYAFSSSTHYTQETQKVISTLTRQSNRQKEKEPIYESIKPRPEPVGGSGNSPPQSEYQSTPPVPTQDSQYGFGNLGDGQQAATRRARPVLQEQERERTRKRTSSTSPGPTARLAQGVNAPPVSAEETEREQRRLQRVRRELERIQEVDEEKEQRREERHDLVEFAENFFNDHERSPSGTIVGTIKRSKTMEVMPKSEMIQFYKGESIPTSHIHMFDPENVSLACGIWSSLRAYSRGDLKGDNEVSAIQGMVQLGLKRDELRDEIYVMLVRQLTNNPNTEHVERLWLLLCLVVVAFPTGKTLYKYFVSFLQSQGEAQGKSVQYVQWCLDNCNRAMAAPRKLPPSSVEIAAMKRLGTIVCRFFFLDGRTKAIDVHPCDTALDSVTKLADKIGLGSVEGWALYQSCQSGETHIPGHHYLYDIISSWEVEQTHGQAKTSPAKTKNNAANKRASSASDNRFIFKKRLFLNQTREIPSDPVEVSLLFAQAVHSVVRCDQLPVSEKVALQLAGLQLQVALGEPQSERAELYQDVDMFLSHRIKAARFITDRAWIPILVEAHNHYGAGKADVVAKVWYLRCIMQYPLYGSTMFDVTFKGYWPHGSNIILAINMAGILLLKPEEKEILFEFAYREIESIFLDPAENIVTITLHKAEGQKVFILETGEKTEVAALVASYCPSLANWIREGEAPLRKVKQVTNEDRLRLQGQLVACRRALVDNESLRKPADDGKGFLKNTLRKLSTKKLEKLRAEALTNEQGEVYRGFPHTYWAFTKGLLATTLTNMAENDEVMAIEVFSLILTYSGLLTPASMTKTEKEEPIYQSKEEEDHVLLIQTVLDKAMKKDCLVNEVFLQLIKQTTDHPEPNSRVNLRHWSLLALACSIILPVDKLVRKYLLAHLKQCSADFVTEEGKYARFAERCFHKTLGTRRRQWPPSKQEILCTINRRPIYARFHFMDGQFHAVEFDPSATAAEVLKLVKAKIGLREGAEGYAIYEVLGQQERSLLADEKVADVMSKWEKYRAAGGTLSRQSRHHMFLFKKHLFLDEYINLTDPVEKELLYYQVLCDLRSDRFPVTDMEAVMLCALRAQIELGDYIQGVGDYRQVMAHCLPPRLLVNLQKEHVSMHHQSLLGLNVEEAKQSFLNLIQCWPLHKATLFDVSQTFTSNWPKALWLAVDQKGIHLLEARTRNVLTTYEYDSLIDYTPSLNHMLMITGTDKKQSKIIVNTNQAFQVSNLIREYMERVADRGVAPD